MFSYPLNLKILDSSAEDGQTSYIFVILVTVFPLEEGIKGGLKKKVPMQISEKPSNNALQKNSARKILYEIPHMKQKKILVKKKALRQLNRK